MQQTLVGGTHGLAKVLSFIGCFDRKTQDAALVCVCCFRYQQNDEIHSMILEAHQMPKHFTLVYNTMRQDFLNSGKLFMEKCSESKIILTGRHDIQVIDWPKQHRVGWHCIEWRQKLSQVKLFFTGRHYLVCPLHWNPGCANAAVLLKWLRESCFSCSVVACLNKPLRVLREGHLSHHPQYLSAVWTLFESSYKSLR